MLGALLLWDLDNDDITSSSADIIVLLLTRGTEEDELFLLLFGGGSGDAKDESSVSARVEDNKRFRKIPRNVEMGELDVDDCGVEMSFNVEVAGMDCSVIVANGTVEHLVQVDLSLGGRFDDNMPEKMVMVVDGTIEVVV